MLFGVIVTSFITESITLSIKKIRSLNKEYEDEAQLAIFMACIKHFNNGKDLDPNLSGSIKEYLEYRWQKNRNMAVQSEEDEKMLTQLPFSVQ